jgi:hypothetical protein
MSKATDTEELPKEEKAAAETPEAKQEREAKRRERSLEIFNEERSSREATLSWIARRDPYGMNHSIVGAVFYDRDLPGREPSALLTEAVADKKITEYSDGRRTWYRSEQVKAAFPVSGLTKPVNKRQAAISAIHELGVGNLASMSQKDREGTVMERLRQKGITVSDKHVRNIWKEQKEKASS